MSAKNALILLLVAALAALGVVFLASGDDHAVLHWQHGDEVPLAEGEVPPEPMSAVFDPGDRVEIEQPDQSGENTVGRGRIPTVITGRVVELAGAPLADAEVLLEIRRTGRPSSRDRNRIRQPVRTSTDGRFTFHGRAYDPLTVTVRVSHPRFAVTVVDRAFARTPAEIDLGDLRMRPGGTFIGTVTDRSGHGIAGARVRVLPQRGNRLAWMRGGDSLLPEGATDASGGYRIANLPAGDYRIVASAPRHEQHTTESEGVDDGEERWLNPIVLGPGHVFAGRVFAASGGQPVADAEVELSRSGWRERTTADKDGQFEIAHVPPANYSLRVQARGYITHYEEEVDVRVERDRVIQLYAGLSISGTVSDGQTGKPVERYAARPRRVGPLPEHHAGANEIEGRLANLRAQLQGLNRDSEAAGQAADRVRLELSREMQALQQLA